MAASQDGITWKKHGKDLLPSVLEEDECQASPDVLYYGGKYHMFFSYRYSIGYRQGEKGYRIGYASSEDLINWKRDDTKAGLDVSDTGWDSEMVSYAHVFEADENVYMIYQGNQMGRYGLGLAKMTSMIQQP
jgi:sucrose-6-phosphate hydrolase SacC (GH32 family)